MIVSFSIKNQKIRRMDYNIVVAQSRNYLRAKFNALTDDWNAPITAIFNEYTVILDDNNECLVPWEVLQNPGTVKVSAFCGDLHTASVATMVVNPSGYVDGQTPEPPTPDVYQTLVQTANNAKNIAQSVRDDADAGLFDGRPGEPGPQGPTGPRGPQGARGPAGLDAPQIDDTKITTANPWSSAKIVDTVCPPFEVSGPIVTCNPMAGTPLHVVSQIVPVQEGEGDQSPDNVRPIKGWDKATLMHNDTPISFSFGQTVYGGMLDWTTGALTVYTAHLQLTSALAIQEYTFLGTKGVAFSDLFNVALSREKGVSSHADIDTLGGSPSIYPGGYMWIGVNNIYLYWIGILDVLGIQTIEDFKSWLDTQYVQVVYTLPDPISIQLTPQEIQALSGVNTIYTDTGDTTVSGRADPIAVLQQLAERIDAMQSMSQAVSQLNKLDTAYRNGVNSI